MLRWTKLGLIFRPDSRLPWMRTHAAAPAPLQLRGSTYRVFFACRDADNRSHVGFFDIDLDQPERIISVSEEPVLVPGPLGYFDDHGVYASCALRHDDLVYLYTIGWNPGPKPPLFYSSIGLAISRDGGTTFQKYGRSPIMERSDFDPCLVTGPVVLKEGSRWRMWYVSGVNWEIKDGAAQSLYHIKYAESDNGIDWRRDGTVCIDNSGPGERNISRTCVVREENEYHAWFSSSRGDGYRIGFAVSRDGILWERKPTPKGLELSASGWDSEAMAYPYVIKHKNRWFMFYNGNGFGRDGVGLAVLEGQP